MSICIKRSHHQDDRNLSPVDWKLTELLSSKGCYQWHKAHLEASCYCWYRGQFHLIYLLVTCMCGHSTLSASLEMVQNWEEWLIYQMVVCAAIQKGFDRLEKWAEKSHQLQPREMQSPAPREEKPHVSGWARSCPSGKQLHGKGPEGPGWHQAKHVPAIAEEKATSIKEVRDMNLPLYLLWGKHIWSAVSSCLISMFPATYPAPTVLPW